MATDLEQLNVTFNAKFDQFSRQLVKVDQDFAKATRSIQTKRDALMKKLAFPDAGKFLGIDRIAAAVAGLSVVGIGAGIAELTLKALDAAKAIGEVAQQAGISDERLQMLRFAASQTGGSFDNMDAALIYFNRTFGEFINTGAGKGAVAFKELGLQAAVNSGKVRDSSQAFDFIIEKIRGFSNESQKAAFASRVFGAEAGPKMVGFIDAGAKAVSDLEDKARALGIVLSTETIRGATEARDKLSALFKVMEIQGVNAIAHLAPQIAELTQKIIDGLPSLIAWVEHWADFFGLMKASPLTKARYELDAAKESLRSLLKASQDSPNAVWAPHTVDSMKKATDEVKRLEKEVSNLQAGSTNRYHTTLPIGGPPALHVNDLAGQAAAAAAAKAAAAKQAAENLKFANELIDQLARQYEDIAREEKAWNKTLADSNVEVEDQIRQVGLYGQALYALQKQQELIQKFKDEHDQRAPGEADLAAINAVAAAYGREKVSLEELQKIEAARVQVTDELRTGLEDVAVAGLHGFKSMRDAAAQFLEQLAEMILKLYVLKPLLDNLLGQQGTSGGGFLGSLLGDIFGSTPTINPINYYPAAKGGIMTPSGPRMIPRFAGGGISNGIGIFGEAGPEAAVPLPDGRRIPVALRLPSARQMGRGGPTVINAPVTVHQSLAGAISAEGVAQISQTMAVAVGQQFSKEIKKNFSNLMVKSFRDDL